jgi:hypothetical protein
MATKQLAFAGKMSSSLGITVASLADVPTLRVRCPMLALSLLQPSTIACFCPEAFFVASDQVIILSYKR